MFCGGSRMCVDLQTNDTCRLFKKGGAKKKTAKLKLSQKSYRKETIVRNEPLSCMNNACKQTGNAHIGMVFCSAGALIKNNHMKGNCL